MLIIETIINSIINLDTNNMGEIIPINQKKPSLFHWLDYLLMMSALIYERMLIISLMNQSDLS